MPDPLTVGPKIIQIGTESGFLPNAVIHPNQPINFNYNRRDIVVLNVQEKNLFMGAAERADIIIDFSQVPPGSTVILYNDSPSPVPAGDPRQDYYTGNPDQTAGGGAPSTLRGFGPNTRTIMQFRVAGTPAAPFNLANLQAALPVAFKNTQPAPVVPQPTYPVASGGNGQTELYAKIQDYSMTFTPIGATVPTTIPFQPKAIQELWDPYGRMNATLGVELPFTTGRNQTTVPMGYAEPATERIVDGHVQMWKITHNGVDTHPVHFHMFDVQVINRVGWDGAIRPPDDNELGWKETLRMNPLEDIIVALRPKAQTLPFVQPISKRAIDPTLPDAAMIATTDVTTNPVAGIATTVRNVPLADPLGYDYGYEYVWHCHILGHEENDFMRPVIFAVSTTQAPQPTLLAAYLGGQTVPGKAVYIAPYTNTFANKVVLQWVDNSPFSTPSNFLVERDSGAGFLPLTTISYLPGYPPIYTDWSVAPGVSYSYRVKAQNAFLDSLYSNTAAVTTPAYTAATGVTLTASKPTPHIVGTNVQFTAVGSGATATAPQTVAYQYRFLVNGIEVQAYSNSSVWTMPDTTPIGSYTVTVQVRTSPAVAFDVQGTTTPSPYLVVATPIPPVTLPNKIPGIYAAAPVAVTLTADVPTATIYYTTNGTIPTTATLTSFVGSGTITLNATTTINYFAVDVNGNAEAVHTGETWVIHPVVGATFPTGDLSATVAVNGGALLTNAANVTLNISAFDPAGIATMMFANGDTLGVCPAYPDVAKWSVEEPYATTKTWPIDVGSGIGLKTVCVKFRDKALPFTWNPPALPVGGIVYPPVTASISYDSAIPFTSASPAQGTFVSGPISVTLTANKPGTIYYTLGTIAAPPVAPTTASTIYTVPIPVSNIPSVGTVIKYFAVDTAGNAEAVKTGTWVMASNQLVATVAINGGATLTNNNLVTLNLNAVDQNPGLSIVTMQFSNVGCIPADTCTNTADWSAEEAYNSLIPINIKSNWNLAFPGTTTTDGLKTVYVRFRNNAIPTGNLYAPVTATITLDTVKPITTASPVAGSYAATPIPVTLTANEPATMYYTVDGTTPTFPVTGTTLTYSTPIQVATDTTIKYFAVDAVGNAEIVKTGTWSIHVGDLVASVAINGGNAVTKSILVNLSLNAVDATGVVAMRFSNTGNINNPTEWTPEEPYAISKAWTLTAGEGLKTVYVQFRDGAGGGGVLYPPVTASITLDTTPPVSTAGPVAGTYAVAPDVTLSSNEPATIYYTIDGSTPTTASAVYVGPIRVATNTTIKYFAVDTAGNIESVKSGTWTIHAGDLVVNTFKINNGAASTNNVATILTIDAIDPGTGVATMSFSNDGLAYSAEEPYTTTKAWNLTPGEGTKVVYARFRDNALGGGILYDPVTTTILFDTTAPATSASPVPGTYSSLAPNPPVNVALTCSDVSGSGCSKIYYTIDGTDPTTGSTQYGGPILVSTSKVIKYRAADSAGNLEAVKSGTWDIHPEDLVASIKINNGISWTVSPSVTLNLSAQDAAGIIAMQFSNDGVTYTPEEQFPVDGITNTTATKAWTLTPGEGVKTVYVRFRDGAGNGGNLYAPLTATIAFGLKDGILPGTTDLLSSVLRTLKIAMGLVTPTSVDLVHADVAPYKNGASRPDGKVNLLDATVILQRALGLIPSF